MPYAEVNGQRIYYEDSGGNGPPVVFSHGYLMDNTMFEPQVEALTPGFRCIRWDERGFGKTEFDNKPFTYWDLANDCLGLMSQLDIDRAVLVGMSQGGFLSLRAALTAPDRVRALVLLATQSGIDDEQTNAGYRALLDAWKAQGVDAVAPTIATILFGAGYDASAWIAKWQKLPLEELDSPFECLVGRDDITSRLGEITCPAIVVHGVDDTAIPMNLAESLCAGLPGCSEVVSVPGAHSTNLTHPDEVTPPVVNFIRNLPE